MRKIMFNDKYGLTKAVLEGRKTQTRRIVPKKVLDKIKQFQEHYYDATFDMLEGVELLTHYFFTEKCGKLPYNGGEVVAVAQSMCDVYAEWDIIYLGKDTKVLMEKFGGSPCFKNKMFVKASEMPHQIRITNVRVENLQDISEQDAIAEGITYAGLTHEDYGEPMFVIDGCKETFSSATDAYAWLIDKISGKGTWNSNPYVFVYNFKLIK